MAEHVWFIPVTGGGSYGVVTAPGQLVVPTWDINVQWSFSNFPTEAPAAAQPILQVVPITQFSRSNDAEVAGALNQCYGSWRWRSCTDGENITVGGQLEVGTVFSRMLSVQYGGEIDYSWDTVEVFAKYRVSVQNRLAGIYIALCDSAGTILQSSPTAAPGDNTWRVIGLRKSSGWDDPVVWRDNNLRAVMTFLGTETPANVGEVIVDIEWFAFRLSDQD